TRIGSVASPRETAPMASAVAPVHRLACRLLRWRRSQAGITSQVAIGQSLAHDGAQRLHESPGVALRVAPLVIAEYLLVNVAMKVERIHGNVGAAQPTLEQTPEVFQ